MELKAQAQTSTNAVVDPPSRNRDAKSPKLPAFTDQVADGDTKGTKGKEGTRNQVQFHRRWLQKESKGGQARYCRNARQVRHPFEEIPGDAVLETFTP